MKTKIRQEIEKSLQLNVLKIHTKTYVNTNKTKSTMKITDVYFTKHWTFEQAKEDIMYISEHIVDVKYKKVKKEYLVRDDWRSFEIMCVFIYFDCKLSEVK